VAASGGDLALYEQYLAQLATLAAQPEAYYRFLNALPWFTSPELSKRTLDYALSPAVRTQDAATLLASMMTKPWSQAMTWEFVQTNWQTLLKRLDEFQSVPSIVESLGGFCSAPRAAEVRTFFEKNPLTSSQRGIQHAIERIESCVALKERQAQPLAQWIDRSRQ
jgi:aminopeptidase N